MTSTDHPYVRAAIDGEAARVSSAKEGERNLTLFRSTAALASLGLKEGEILDRLKKPALGIGLSRREIYETIKSGVKAGGSRPRTIPNAAVTDRSGSHLTSRKSSAFFAGADVPKFNDEARRHTYFRGAVPVRIKIKRRDGGYVNWYRALRDSQVGWQAAKPDGYIDCPYVGSINAFDPKLLDKVIWWPEGEKDCDTLSALGESAFCFGGSGDGLPNFDIRLLAGRHIIILADNDASGRLHADRKAALLHPIAGSLRVAHFPDLPDKGDVSDWLDAGNSIEMLRERVEATPLWIPPIGVALADDKEASESASHRFSWLEPDTSIIDDRRGDLPELPIDVVPPSWRSWLQSSAHGAGVTEAHVFVPLLAISSGLIGTSRRVQASRSWTEPMTMWTAIVGFSGTGKTPGIDVTKRSLAEVQKLKSGAVGELERRHNAKREEAKVARKKWAESVEDAVTNGFPAPPMPENAIEVPAFTLPRLFVSDATVERLAVMLQSRPNGTLYIADELAGLFLNMGRYTGGSDKEFWLEAWNAKPFVVERMGRPAVALEHLLIGVTGGLQPDKLQRSFGMDGDGMYARVLFAWPAEPKYRPLTNDVAEIEPEAVNALMRLVDVCPLGENLAIRHVLLSSEAVHEFEQFRQFLHQAKAGLDGREREWWSKGEAHALRLAGTLAYLEWSRRDAPEPSEISVQDMTSAIRLFRDYLWPHARASLRQIGLSEKHATARKVLRWIKANRTPGQGISMTDIRREALSQSLDENATLDLIEQLEGAAWLRPLTAEATGGRPKKRWEVNPALF